MRQGTSHLRAFVLLIGQREILVYESRWRIVVYSLHMLYLTTLAMLKFQTSLRLVMNIKIDFLS